MQSDVSGSREESARRREEAEMESQESVSSAAPLEVSKQWYVLRVIGGRERRVANHLLAEVARLGYEGLIENVLAPVDKVFQVRNGKKVSKERVVYPGYVFVEACLVDRIVDFLLNAPDVLGFLTTKRRGGEPSALRDVEVKRMLGKVDQLSEDIEMPMIPFREGDSVRVVDGPFNTFSGVVSEVNEEKKKLTVMVKIFERKTPLELDYMQVEKE